MQAAAGAGVSLQSEVGTVSTPKDGERKTAAYLEYASTRQGLVAGRRNVGFRQEGGFEHVARVRIKGSPLIATHMKSRRRTDTMEPDVEMSNFEEKSTTGGPRTRAILKGSPWPAATRSLLAGRRSIDLDKQTVSNETIDNQTMKTYF